MFWNIYSSLDSYCSLIFIYSGLCLSESICWFWFHNLWCCHPAYTGGCTNVIVTYCYSNSLKNQHSKLLLLLLRRYKGINAFVWLRSHSLDPSSSVFSVKFKAESYLSKAFSLSTEMWFVFLFSSLQCVFRCIHVVSVLWNPPKKGVRWGGFNIVSWHCVFCLAVKVWAHSCECRVLLFLPPWILKTL